jgi:hypothetical protein
MSHQCPSSINILLLRFFCTPYIVILCYFVQFCLSFSENGDQVFFQINTQHVPLCLQVYSQHNL